MYRSCIFCSAALGSNDAIERFPVGRSLAFDGEKGRLWAVCGRCARWNLAPIEERWEAMEEAERLFRDTRLRVQRENIGLAKLADGTRLIRIGRAQTGELAAWRYGRQMVGRHRRTMFINTVTYTTALMLPVVGLGLALGAHRGLRWMSDVAAYGWKGRHTERQQLVPRALSPTGYALDLPRGAVINAHLDQADDGALLLRVPMYRRRGEPRMVAFRDDAARSVLARAMLMVNDEGASRRDLEHAVGALAGAGSPEEYIRTVAHNRGVLGGQRAEGTKKMTPTGLRALEMALHEETERRALEGELAMLQAMWRQAEEIAAIADALPDAVPPEPPRLDLVR
jgi:hypothetical protein